MHDEESAGNPPTFMTLRDLMEDRDLLKPPQCVLPRLAYRGRLVILAGPEKSGKSTLLAHGAMALSLGRSFLGEVCDQGRVVWLGLEEALGDAVRRFSELGADPDRIDIVTNPERDLLDQTHKLLTERPADLVIIDSLTEYSRVTLGSPPDDGDNAGWARVMRPLVSLAREFKSAVSVMHHSRRSDGQFRGASEIGAAADAMLELSMSANGQDPTLRQIRGRGRWDIEPFTVALREGRYDLADPIKMSVEARIKMAIEQTPGASLRHVRDAVGGRNVVTDDTLARMVVTGVIVDEGTAGQRAYHLASEEA